MTDKAEASNPDHVTIQVDGVEMQAPKGAMIIEVTDRNGVHVPRFCYHRKLSIAANCRMCLVDVEKAPKPLPACATPVADGMKISTRSERALKAQKGVMEFLLINHPLDCPICDQGGECELQDLALGYGRGVSRFTERKRVVKDENLGPLIATEMTRCIHCTRCVRFLDEVAGERELGGMGRGEHTEISTLVGLGVHSEMSGNVIDLCPVGALTSRPYRFTARAWEMLSHPGVSPHDCVGSNLQLHHLRGRIKRVVPRDNEAINECWLADRDRFSYEGAYSEDRLERPRIKRDGQWQDCSWEDALEAAAGALMQVVEQHGGEQLGALVSPSATVEEQYLAGRLMRALGSRNVDARLRTGDVSDQVLRPAYPALGLPLADIDTLDAALLVGSNPRAEQPIVNHRLRKAALGGAAIHYLNPRRHDFNYPVAEQLVAAPSTLVSRLAAVAAVLLEERAGEAPAGFRELLAGETPDDQARAVAGALREAGHAAVMLGPLTEAHPQGAALRALAGLVADLSGASVGYLSEGANTAGAWLAGAVPHRQAGGKAESSPGLDAVAMLAEPRKGYLLLGVEPELDCWDSATAMASLQQAQTVVALTAYVTPALEACANVLLPMGAFGETSGTFVNAEGTWQSFPGVTSPLGEARPAWKVLRVLGNVLQLGGFEYQSSEAVLAELHALLPEDAGETRMAWQAPAAGQDSGGLERVGLLPLYGTDPLVRRAGSLQQTRQARDRSVRISPATAERLQLAGADAVEVIQGDQHVRMPLVVDEGMADDAVWVPAGIRETAALGPAFGPVELKGV
ncbi:MAG: NADH-quinone oxidoreductase subunit G [Ectothiorhodospiraceae bacterium]|nr:NADH-quinone oxidoreductase subunit G [Ectothiorhodospiraceae bacterium]